MKRAGLLSLVIAIAVAQEKRDAVFRVDVNLVQVDAVVTDSHGRQVTNLTANDFEILEDGRLQTIANFAYVSTAPQSASTAIASGGQPASVLALPGSPLPAKPRRTIVLVVDDLGLSFESAYYVRRALHKFVDQQMQPGDLVAVIRTRAGMGALQQFTSDRRLLHEAIDHVRWYLAGRGAVSAFEPLGASPEERVPRSGRTGTPDRLSRPRDLATFDEARDESLATGTIGALRFLIRGLRDQPGRKSVILFSDGVPIFLRGQLQSRTLDGLRELTDLANRAAVVLYTVDARGLQTLALTASDNPLLDSDATEELNKARGDRSETYFASQQGLDYLAHQTGGFFVHESNDMNWGLSRILEDLNGYYLIGYKPAEATFQKDGDRRRFHKIQVRLKVRGLHVRSRTGFFGVPDEDTRPVYTTREEQLRAAITSPFSSGVLRLRLTSLFLEAQESGAFVRNLLYVDARDLSFTGEPDGKHKAVLDVVVLAFDEQGNSVDENSKTYNMELNEEEYRMAIDHGFLDTLELPIKKPGAYQVRAAVRDANSSKIGTANQFLEVPDLKKGRLTLSSILVAEAAQPATRVFSPGTTIHYTYRVFNARGDKADGHSRLDSRVLLLQDGKAVFTGPLASADVKKSDRFQVSGALNLPPSMAAGTYVLEAVVTDRLAREKYATATQTMDLEVAPAR